MRIGAGVAVAALLALVLSGCSTDRPNALALSAQATPLESMVLATGLNSPRGLAVTPDGAVLVAEAGMGGDGPCATMEAEGQTEEVCIGATGSVTRIKNGVQERIVTGLPSLITSEGALGPSDVSVHGNGNTDVILGLGGDPRTRVSLFGELGGNLGHIVRMHQRQGTVDMGVDISAFEADYPNPDGGDPGSYIDSDPYALARIPGGFVVADAGGNDLLHVDPQGNVHLLAVFHALSAPNPFDPGGPDIPMQAVPTSVVVGPDGAYYVGILTGFPFEPGAAVVYRVVPGQAPEVFADGFTNIIGLDFGPDGNLYVVEMVRGGLLNVDFTDPSTLAGALYRVAPDGTKAEVPVQGLVLAGGIAMGRDGTAYISTCTVCTTAEGGPGGQVIAVRP